MPDGSAKQLTINKEGGCCCNKKADSSGVEKNRNFVAQRWVRESSPNNQSLNQPDYKMDELDAFIARIKSHGFTITGMAFQDCWNIDLERLHECSLHVLSPEGKIIPFCAYNITSTEGKSLYRKNILHCMFFHSNHNHLLSFSPSAGDQPGSWKWLGHFFAVDSRYRYMDCFSALQAVFP